MKNILLISFLLTLYTGYSFAQCGANQVEVKVDILTDPGNDVQFILGKLESKDFGLIGISKTTGQKTIEINFGKDKEPKYILDDVSRTIYYLSESMEMKAVKY